MTWLIERFTGKLAIYTCAALLGIVALLSVGLGIQTSRHDKEVRAHAETTASLNTARADITRITQANTDWKNISDGLEKKLAHAVAENERVAKEGADAVAKAKRAEKRARDELSAFNEVFANKTPSCKNALVTMEAACTELSDY